MTLLSQKVFRRSHRIIEKSKAKNKELTRAFIGFLIVVCVCVFDSDSYEGKVKDAKAALLHSQHEALILGEKLKAAEARIAQLEEVVSKTSCGDKSRGTGFPLKV